MKFGQWVGCFCLIVALYILWQIKDLLLLVFAAVVISTALNRLVRRLLAFGLRPEVAFSMTILITLLFVFLFFVLIVLPFINQFQELITTIPAGWERIRVEILALEQRLPNWVPPPPSLAEITAQIQPIARDLLTNSFALFQNSLAIFLQLLLVIVLTLMMLANPQAYRQALIKLFPSFYRRRADEILSKSEVALGNWLGAITVSCAFIGTFCGIGMWILQVKLVLAHGLLAGLLNFIPNIGPAASILFPVLIALLDAPWKMVPIIIWYTIVQQIEVYWVTPSMMAKQVSLLPAVTLMAQVFFASTFGALGLLLSLPLTVIAKVWIEEVLFKDIMDRWHERHKPRKALSAVVPSESQINI